MEFQNWIRIGNVAMERIESKCVKKSIHYHKALVLIIIK